MNNKKIIPVTFFIGFILCLGIANGMTAQEQTKQPVQIPDNIKSSLEKGMISQEGQTDIGITNINNYYFPTTQNLHNIFLFECKNSDLGFTPKAHAEGEEPYTEESPAPMQAGGFCYLRIYNKQDGQPGTITAEYGIPFSIEIAGKEYDPEQTGVYSIAYPLPEGEYLLSIALCSKNHEKIGTQYYNFTLPGMTFYGENLETTSLYFIKKMEQIAAVEQTPQLHKENFIFAYFKITPFYNSIIKPEDNLHLLFFIYGVKPTVEGQYNYEINYEIVQDGKPAIRWPAQKYQTSPVVDQPLPLVKTVIITSTDDKGKKTEREEKRNLEPGKYSLKLSLKDNITGSTLQKILEFEIK